MTTVDFATLQTLQSAADPNGAVFKQCMDDLLSVSERGAIVPLGISTANTDRSWRRIFPFCGSAVQNRYVSENYPSFCLADYCDYNQGVISIALIFKQVCQLFDKVSRNAGSRVLIVSSFARQFADLFSASNPLVDTVDYCHTNKYAHALAARSYDVVIFDHTTVTSPVDSLLHVCYSYGVKVVEGLFWYHVAAARRWDGTFGNERIMFDHTSEGLNVGAADDPTRMTFYKTNAYNCFIDPTLWQGDSRKFFYEVKATGILSSYTAVNVGVVAPEKFLFKLPSTSSKDYVLISIDRSFADGVFAARSEQPISTIFDGARDYAFEVRRKLFDDCVMYLVAKPKGADLTNEAIKYFTAHNYSDLVDGTRVVECVPLSYTRALCAAVVAAVTAYTLRFNLTNESVRAITNTNAKTNALVRPTLGIVGKFVSVLSLYARRVTYDIPREMSMIAKNFLSDSSVIPGVFYDVYRDHEYTVGASWTETLPRRFFHRDTGVPMTDDAITRYLGDTEDTSANDYLIDSEDLIVVDKLSDGENVFDTVSDPVGKLQDVYDTAFPGNSIADLANVAELRKTTQIDVQTSFVGRVKPNYTADPPELLHEPMPLRTSTLPASKASLVDLILASAKRNFSSPDMHEGVDVWGFAKSLVGEFLDRACVPGARKICAAYAARPKEVNLTSYLAWASEKNEAFRAALAAETPDELVELNMERYSTMVKSRVKPKLSVAAQRELGAPQVIVHHTKVETAVFSGVFRDAFARFDSLLKDEFKSAGRSSDDDISEWATKFAKLILTCALLEGDSTMFDKSQSLLAMCIEVELLIALGVSFSVTRELEKSFIGNVSARNFGLSFVLSMMRYSGRVDTMLGNMIYNFVSIGHCVGYEKVKAMIAKGDDNLLVLDSMTDEESAVAAEKMAKYFNLETKMILHFVPGFSSGGFVPLHNEIRFFPDPLKMIELLGEREADSMYLREKHQSFRDKVASFNHSGLPHLVAEWTRTRYSVHADIEGAINALYTIASDFELFCKIKGHVSDKRV